MKEVTIITENHKESGREITEVAGAITPGGRTTGRSAGGNTRGHRRGERTVIPIDTENVMREAGAEAERGETSQEEDHVMINTSREGVQRR